MKIAFIVEFPTQFEVPFFQYIQSQKQNDFEFEVIYNFTDKQDYVDQELGKAVKWGFNLYEGYPYFIANKDNIRESVKEILMARNYDFIILNGYKKSYKGLPKLCRSLNLPIALRIDSVLYNQTLVKRTLKKIFLPRIYKQFDHFFAVGSETRKYLKWLGFKDHQISYFSYATDDDRFKAQAQDHSKILLLKQKFNIQDEKVLLSVAKFIDRESPWDILKAFIKLNRTDLILILVGDGSLSYELKTTASHHPHLKIFFPGYISYSELGYYYGLADVFVHSAKNEPWGVSVQEALSSGCTVITSDKVGASVDLIDEELNGFIYPYGDIEQLKKILLNSLELDKEKMKEATAKKLAEWNYESMWKQLKKGVTKF